MDPEYEHNAWQITEHIMMILGLLNYAGKDEEKFYLTIRQNLLHPIYVMDMITTIIFE